MRRAPRVNESGVNGGLIGCEGRVFRIVGVRVEVAYDNQRQCRAARARNQFVHLLQLNRREGARCVVAKRNVAPPKETSTEVSPRRSWNKSGERREAQLVDVGIGLNVGHGRVVTGTRQQHFPCLRARRSRGCSAPRREFRQRGDDGVVLSQRGQIRLQQLKIVELHVVAPPGAFPVRRVATSCKPTRSGRSRAISLATAAARSAGCVAKILL